MADGDTDYPELQEEKLTLDRILDNDKLRMRLQTAVVCVILILVCTILTITNLGNGYTALGVATGLYALVSLGSLVLTIASPRPGLPSTVIVSAAVPLFTYLLYTGGADNFSPIWIILMPSTSMFLLGKTRGTVTSLVMMVILTGALWSPLADRLATAYTATFRLRFPLLYMSAFLMAFGLEFIRHRAQGLLESSRAELARLSVVDQLTGLKNRRGFDMELQEAWRYTQRARSRLAIILLDIDFFKQYNDRNSHLAGDGVLEKVAAAVTGCLARDTDCACRWGGEEFAVILPFTEQDGALNMARRMHDAVKALGIRHEGAPSGDGILSVSLGCACAAPGQGDTPQALFARADTALYAAKNQGRDRAVAFCAP